MDRPTFDQLKLRIDDLRRRNEELAELVANQPLPNPTESITTLLTQLEAEAWKQVNVQFVACATRVRLHDDKYRLERVIDGDTLVVKPPSELRDWVRNIRVRLYGVDTPESSDPSGSLYTDVLRKLCQLDSGALDIVWESVRRG